MHPFWRFLLATSPLPSPPQQTPHWFLSFLHNSLLMLAISLHLPSEHTHTHTHTRYCWNLLFPWIPWHYPLLKSLSFCWSFLPCVFLKPFFPLKWLVHQGCGVFSTPLVAFNLGRMSEFHVEIWKELFWSYWIIVSGGKAAIQFF